MMRIGFKEHKTLQAFNPQRLQKLSSKTLHEFLGVRYAAEDDGQVSGKKLFGVDVISGQVGGGRGGLCASPAQTLTCGLPTCLLACN